MYGISTFLLGYSHGLQSKLGKCIFWNRKQDTYSKNIWFGHKPIRFLFLSFVHENFPRIRINLLFSWKFGFSRFAAVSDGYTAYLIIGVHYVTPPPIPIWCKRTLPLFFSKAVLSDSYNSASLWLMGKGKANLWCQF